MQFDACCTLAEPDMGRGRKKPTVEVPEQSALYGAPRSSLGMPFERCLESLTQLAPLLGFVIGCTHVRPLLFFFLVGAFIVSLKRSCGRRAYLIVFSLHSSTVPPELTRRLPHVEL